MNATIAVAGILILAVLAAISTTDQAFAQKKTCGLTLNVSPDYNVNRRLNMQW